MRIDTPLIANTIPVPKSWAEVINQLKDLPIKAIVDALITLKEDRELSLQEKENVVNIDLMGVVF